MEDAVVSPALDKYSSWKRSKTDLSDEQLIEIEEKQGYCCAVITYTTPPHTSLSLMISVIVAGCFKFTSAEIRNLFER